MARPRSRWIRTCTLTLIVSGALLGGCHKIFGEYKVVPDPPPSLCVAGDQRCVGPFLYTCGADLDSWAAQGSCRSDAHCASREGGCLECVPGEYHCNEGVLEVCGDDGGFSVAEDCGDPNRCNLNSDSCRPCTEGEFQCDRERLMWCTPDHVWMVTTCANEAACSVEPDRRTGFCIEDEVCPPGKHACYGAELKRCAASGREWVEIDNCKSEELCDAAAADQAAANNLLGGCLEVCSDGQCEAAACPVAGQTRCGPNGVLEECLPDQSTWNTITYCDGNLCNANDGACDPPACAAGAKRCWNNTLEICSPDLRNWDVLEACEAGETCSLEGCSASPCDAGAFRCNDIYLETCDGAAWQHVDRCATPAFCDPSQPLCEAPTCELDDFICDGASLKQCQTNDTDHQTSYKDVGFCKPPEVCDAAAGECLTAP